MPDLAEGAVFAGHRIDGVAGRGGMGTVYRATHLALDHMVALKVIAADLADDDSFRERFKSESRIAVSLRHPNVVPIHHAGEEDGLLFVTMDLIDGPDLRKLLISRGPLDPEQAVSILEQVGSALDVAHSRGLVHRDIKPGNILIEERRGADHAYLTDFGLTKRMDQAGDATGLTSTGAFVGTLDYVAPEQIRGEDLDARTDVYALGCVLQEMLTATAPFSDREEKVAKMYAHLQDEPGGLEGRLAPFDEVVVRAMEKDREGRYPSAGDLARAARAALQGGQPIEAERSVATGPAAPTEVYDTPPGEKSPAAGAGAAAAAGGAAAGDLEPTVESAPPASEPEPEPTVESAPPFSTAAGSEPEPPEEPPAADSGRTVADREPPPTSRQPVPAGDPGGGGRSRWPLTALVLGLFAAAAVGAVLTLGGSDGGEGSTTTTSQGQGQGGGGGGQFDPRVINGGVSGGELPVGAAVSGQSVYVADRSGFQVLKGNAGSFEDEGSVAVAAQPEDLIPMSGSMWVTLPKGDQVVRLSKDLVVEGSVQLPPGSEPSGIAAGGGSIWVTNQGTGTVTEVDPETTTEVGTVALDATRPHGIAYDEGILWVTDRSAGTVIKHDLAAGQNENIIGVGANPKGVAVAAGAVWVANTDSGTVSILDAETGASIGQRIEVGGQPRAVDVLDGRVWVSNGDDRDKDLAAKSGWVSVFDAASRELLEREVRVGGSPEGLAVGAGRVWVATGPEQLVRAINPG